MGVKEWGERKPTIRDCLSSGTLFERGERMKKYCDKCNKFVDFHTKENEDIITVNGVEKKVMLIDTYCNICDKCNIQ